MNLDTIKLFASNLASIHAAEGRRAQIALEMIEAKEQGKKPAEVASKYGLSVRKANQIKRSYLDKAEKMSSDPELSSSLSLMTGLGIEVQPEKEVQKVNTETRKVEKPFEVDPGLKKLLKELDGDKQKFIRHRMLHGNKTSSRANKEFDALMDSAEL